MGLVYHHSMSWNVHSLWTYVDRMHLMTKVYKGFLMAGLEASHNAFAWMCSVCSDIISTHLILVVLWFENRQLLEVSSQSKHQEIKNKLLKWNQWYISSWKQGMKLTHIRLSFPKFTSDSWLRFQRRWRLNSHRNISSWRLQWNSHQMINNSNFLRWRGNRVYTWK